MAPRRSPLRTDVTAEQLRRKAAQVKSPPQKDKWNTLADVYDGSLHVDGLPEKRRATVVRWVKELYKEKDLAAVLSGRKPGPPIPVPEDRSATEFRSLAQGAEGRYRARLLACAVLIETGDILLAARTAGVEKIEFLKILGRYKRYGLQALEEKTARIDPSRFDELRQAASAAEGTAEEPIFNALLALTEEGATLRSVCRAFKMNEGTLSGRVDRFNMGGAGEFALRSEKDAEALRNSQNADLLRQTAKQYRHDGPTYKNCMAVSEALDGGLKRKVSNKYGMNADTLTKRLRDFERDGLYSLVSDTAFHRRGEAFSEALSKAASSEQGETRRSALYAASWYHQGTRLAECAKKSGTDKLTLKAILAGVGDADIHDIPAAALRHWKVAGGR